MGVDSVVARPSTIGLDTNARPVIAYGPPEASIVGALHLRPGDDAGFDRLCALLRSWLG